MTARRTVDVIFTRTLLQVTATHVANHVAKSGLRRPRPSAVRRAASVTWSTLAGRRTWFVQIVPACLGIEDAEPWSWSGRAADNNEARHSAWSAWLAHRSKGE